MKNKTTVLLFVLTILALLAIGYYWITTKHTSVTPAPDKPVTTQAPQKLFLNLAYTLPVASALSNKQTLDLHLPDTPTAEAPLLIFIPGGFWADPDKGFLLSAESINELTTRGIAVAQLHFRTAPEHMHPAQINDVAEALSFLISQAGQYGYNANNIYLLGHSSGGHLAALLVQDEQYLGRYNLSSSQLAGVAIISGIFDVSEQAVISPQQGTLYETAFGKDATTRIDASPITHIRAQLPPMLLLSAEQDLPGFGNNTRKYMLKIRAAGNTNAHHHVMSRNTHLSTIALQERDNPVLRYLLAFMNVESGGDFFHKRLMARRFWHEPPLTTEDFWKHKSLVKSHAIDERFAQSLVRLLQGNSYMLNAWPLEQFHAIDLYDYLDLTQTDKGRYLVTKNIRDERMYLDLEKLKPYQPVIVVGLDDEQNLFRLSVFYETRREYSWLVDTQPRPLSVRPLGAFLYFLKPPPDELIPRHLSLYSLTSDSFTRVAKDPLAWLWKLPKVLHPPFTYENGCVSCHAFNGMTAQSHHTDAITLQAHGGFARPLTSYPAEVWREFVFNQEAAAAQIGVVPNSLREEVQQPLFDLIEKARQQQQ